MRILPILFNTEMVRAIQDGRKTATRRAMKPQPLFYTGRKYIFDDKEIPKKWEDCDNIIETYQYQPGDILYVRETWGWEPCWACGMDVEIGGCIYEHTRVYNQKKENTVVTVTRRLWMMGTHRLLAHGVLPSICQEQQHASGWK